jgi:mono/diheme cytochrome c family protein
MRRSCSLHGMDVASPNHDRLRTRPRLALLVALVLGAFACADETDLSVTGADLYRRHCAACHGPDARGGGPVAPSLKVAPPDLTTLARRAGGEFRESHVMAVIDGRYAVAAHGPREMPVWGAVFTEEMVGRPTGVYEAIARSRALADYLRSIQVPE